LLLNQQDHSWIIWVLFSFTIGGHCLDKWNLNPKLCTLLMYMALLNFWSSLRLKKLLKTHLDARQNIPHDSILRQLRSPMLVIP
jgi:hypothetical protein